MRSRVLVKEIEKAGWILTRIRGDHHIFTHPERAGMVVIPHPKKDLPKGTVHAILKQAGLKE